VAITSRRGGGLLPPPYSPASIQRSYTSTSSSCNLLYTAFHNSLSSQNVNALFITHFIEHHCQHAPLGGFRLVRWRQHRVFFCHSHRFRLPHAVRTGHGNSSPPSRSASRHKSSSYLAKRHRHRAGRDMAARLVVRNSPAVLARPLTLHAGWRTRRTARLTAPLASSLCAGTLLSLAAHFNACTRAHPLFYYYLPHIACAAWLSLYQLKAFFAEQGGGMLMCINLADASERA